jgi:uncharacterized protein YecT (DUF1311 family)
MAATPTQISCPGAQTHDRASTTLSAQYKWKGCSVRIISLIFSGAPLLLLPFAFAAGAAHLDDCVAGSQADMRRCLERKSQESSASLAAAETAALSAVANWDEDEKYRKTASIALSNTSKSFIQFRQAQCDFASSLGGGAIGNALTLRRLRCVTDLNQRQAESLRLETSNLPTK